jgi:hypothetical protein
MLDEFDASVDHSEMKKSVTRKTDAPGVRRSARQAAIMGAKDPGQKSFVTVYAETREDDKSEEVAVKVDSEVCPRTDGQK